MKASPHASLPKQSEAAVQRAVLKMLAARERLGQLVADRRNTGGMTDGKGQFLRFGKPGDSDIIGTLRGGRTFAIEVKREGWKPPKPGPSAAWKHWKRQLDRLTRINRVGGLGVVVTTAKEADDLIEAGLRWPYLMAEVKEDGTVKLYTGEGS